jgi:SSS family solute:Na+ symporter
MFLSVVMVLVFSFMKYGGANYLTANLDASYFSIQGRNNSMLDLLIWFFIAVVTTFMSPVFYQRCFAAKSTRVAKMGISISVVFWMIFDFCTVVGSMYAKASQPDTPLHEVYFNYAINVLPIGLKGVFIAGIAATILSTLDSFLFICVTTLIYDIGGKRFVKSQKFKIASLLFIGSITFFIASKFKSDIVLLYGFFARYCRVTLAIPLMLTILLGKKIDEKQFVWSIVIAILSMIVNDLIIHESKVKSFYVGAMASFSVFFIFMCVNFFLKKMLKK